MVAGPFGNGALGSIPQISSAIARCSGLFTTMSAGSRLARVPTSRAVPQAEGCPVRLKGLFPGRLILPVMRWRSVMRLFIQVPRTCWFTPMHQRLTVPRP